MSDLQVFSLTAHEDYPTCITRFRELLINQQRTEERLNQAESALNRSEQKLRALYSIVPDVLFCLNKHGFFVDYKAEDKRTPLTASTTFVGKHVTDILPEAAAQETILSLNRAMETGEPQIYLCQLELKNHLRFFEVRCSLCGEEDVLFLVRDVTRS